MGVSEFVVMRALGEGEMFEMVTKHQQGKAMQGQGLAAFQLMFTAILIYLFILCLLVLPGLILDQPVLEECHDKGFACVAGCEKLRMWKCLGAFGPPIYLFEVLQMREKEHYLPG